MIGVLFESIFDQTPPLRAALEHEVAACQSSDDVRVAGRLPQAPFEVLGRLVITSQVQQASSQPHASLFPIGIDGEHLPEVLRSALHALARNIGHPTKLQGTEIIVIPVQPVVQTGHCVERAIEAQVSLGQSFPDQRPDFGRALGLFLEVLFDLSNITSRCLDQGPFECRCFGCPAAETLAFAEFRDRILQVSLLPCRATREEADGYGRWPDPFAFFEGLSRSAGWWRAISRLAV